MSTRAGLTIIGILIVALAAAAMLAGCGTPAPFKGVCAVQPIGQTEGGMAAFRYYCEPDDS